MLRRDSGWPLYVGTAVIGILGLWTTYLLQLRLDAKREQTLAALRSSAHERGTASADWISPSRLAPAKLDSIAAPERPQITADASALAAWERVSSSPLTIVSRRPSAAPVAAPDASAIEQVSTTQEAAAADSPVAAVLRSASHRAPANDSPQSPTPASTHDPASPFRSASSSRDVTNESTNESTSEATDDADRSTTPLAQPEGLAPENEDAGIPEANPSTPSTLRPLTGAWTEPVALRQRLDQLREEPSLVPYVDRISEILDRWRQLSSIADPRLEPLLVELAEASVVPANLAPEIEQAWNPRLGETQFEIHKRIEIARALSQVTSRADLIWVSESASSVDATRSVAEFTVLREALMADPTTQGWIEYLCLDQLQNAFADGEINTIDRELILRVLRRTVASRLDNQQSNFLADKAFNPFFATLRDEIVDRSSPTDLQRYLEAYDATRDAAVANRLATSIEALRWSTDPTRIDLGDRLESNYRNANLRFTVSEAFINRLLPETQTTQEPVEDRMLGARVIGTSRTENRLRVRLVPDQKRWMLGLEAQGTVASRTRAIKSGFVFHNHGLARFEATKVVALGREGLALTESAAVASSTQQTTGIEGELDAVPLIGPLARAIAVQQRNEQEAIAKRLVENKVARTASDRMEQEIRTRFTASRARLQKEVIDPLDSLGLEPQTVELQTTEQRLVVRYRVAGYEQLAADTPRPQALDTSLVSFQIHESAINNFLDSLQLGGQRFDLPALATHLSSRLERPITLGKDVEEQVSVAFPEQGWLRMRFDDGLVKIKLRLDAIELDGRRWNGVEAEAEYIPIVSGRQLTLIRDPERPVVISGRRLRMRDQMALRGVMNAIFHPEQSIEVVPKEIVDDPRMEKTAIGQLVIENGWVGVSIVDVPENGAVEPETRSVGFIERLQIRR